MKAEPTNLTIDASGLRCPLPLLKARQGLNQLSCGQQLTLIATDPASFRDLHSFVSLTNHLLLSAEYSEQRYIYVLQKGAS